MKQIRYSVFETNSSSNHSFMAGGEDLPKDKSDFIFIIPGKYNTGDYYLSTPAEKASYFITVAIGKDDPGLLKDIIKALAHYIYPENVFIPYTGYHLPQTDYKGNEYVSVKDIIKELNDFEDYRILLDYYTDQFSYNCYVDHGAEHFDYFLSEFNKNDCISDTIYDFIFSESTYIFISGEH